jgi:hypothetical protein
MEKDSAKVFNKFWNGSRQLDWRLYPSIMGRGDVFNLRNVVECAGWCIGDLARLSTQPDNGILSTKLS